MGIGSFFNLMNFGQMYSYHVFLLPLAVVGLVVACAAGPQARDRATLRGWTAVGPVKPSSDQPGASDQSESA